MDKVYTDHSNTLEKYEDQMNEFSTCINNSIDNLNNLFKNITNKVSNNLVSK